ncbi:hypothetical protein BJF83_21480 [Nocardiopsis sp. CNR-923]|uniref:ParB/RepB/Spo0J family partition protein n=1 Tax=Nocardiopsis sp. CNR-923 TaxID=1904965 RepID=UPI0009648CB4|nr:ParB/RepB/Spo0J family partition protein [Nocardiopsis sp. CNR-923]OLT26375.1 hypothetical protein BJF83_21480 [Nocardiopsis sp. CNR-923]
MTTQKTNAKPKSATKSRPKTKPTPKETLEELQIGRVIADPDQPRQFFDQDKLDELAASLKERGLKQPVVVRWVPALRKFVIVMGERRWRAAKQLGWKTITARVTTADGPVLLDQIAENTARDDMTPMEEARAFHRAVQMGYTVEDVAASCGKSTAYVQWRMDLLSLNTDAQDAVDAGHLPLNVAWYMRELSSDAQQAMLSKWVRGEFASVRDAEAAAKARRSIERDEQSELFHVEELTPAEKDQLRRDRARTMSKIDQLSKAGELLAELAGMDPAALAQQLHGVAGGAAVYQERLAALQATASRAVANMRTAAAFQTAGEMGRPVLVEPTGRAGAEPEAVTGGKPERTEATGAA